MTEENLAPLSKESETEVKITATEAKNKDVSKVAAEKKEASKAETKTEKKLENIPEKK